MFFIGITGGIATGKSTVSSFFSELGCPIIDADLIAREVVEPGQPAWKAIVQTFGDDILLDNGQLNRKKLRSIIFADTNKRTTLNSITHPQIYKIFLWRILKLFLKGERFVILDIPLLFESPSFIYKMLIKYTVVVSCDSETQLSRLTRRDDVSEESALQSINAQMPLADKCSMASFVIDNSKTKDKTHQQTVQLYKTFRSSWAYLPLRLGVLLYVAVAMIPIIFLLQGFLRV